MAKYVEFKLKVITCPKCQKEMIDANYYDLVSVFPKYTKMNFKVQISRKNMVIRSKIEENWHHLCENCKDKMEFICYGCKETRLKKDIKHEHGNPPDFLCRHCYNTKTAKEWKLLKENIAENHRYDYC